VIDIMPPVASSHSADAEYHFGFLLSNKLDLVYQLCVNSECNFSGIAGSARLMLSACSGIMLALAFPKLELTWVVWFALVPMLFAIEETSLWGVFAYSWLAGFVFFATVLYAVPVALITYGHASVVAAIAKLILLAALEAFSIGAALFLGETIVRRLHVPRITTLPIAWVSLELLRTYLPVGFPWALLGYAAYRDVTLIQFAEFTGIYGVSALIVMVNVSAYEILAQSQTFKAKLMSAGPALGVVCIALLFGTARITQLRATAPAGSLRIAFVQANIPQSLKWQQSNVEPTFQIYAREMFKASRWHPDVVIWPEAAVPFAFIASGEYGPFQFHRAYHDRLVTLVRATRQPLLFGAPALNFDDGISTRNRADLLSADGEVVGYYDKMLLVPFDEYVPMARLLGRFIDKPVESIGPISAGTRQAVLRVKNANLGVLICYESIFPSAARNSIRAGANILVNLSNDAWFGTTSAPYQLLAMAAIRALENHTVMVRVANSGISAVISPTGEILSETKLGTMVTAANTVSWINSRTFYTEHGDLFAELCMTATTIGALLILVLPTRK
jgi:apolipoprotein N-acyltransferase